MFRLRGTQRLFGSQQHQSTNINTQPTHLHYGSSAPTKSSAGQTHTQSRDDTSQRLQVVNKFHHLLQKIRQASNPSTSSIKSPTNFDTTTIRNHPTSVYQPITHTRLNSIKSNIHRSNNLRNYRKNNNDNENKTTLTSFLSAFLTNLSSSPSTRPFTPTLAQKILQKSQKTLLSKHKFAINSFLTTRSSPLIAARRFYRRRYFVDPAQSHQYSGWAQGFGYATRLEEKFQPGSTHIVSALPVMEQHEYRQPVLLRFRNHFVRKLWSLFDKPYKMMMFAALIMFVVPVYIYWISRQWNKATRMRTNVNEYLAMGGLALTLHQLDQMIFEDLIEFQNEEAKHQFLGVLDGVREEVRKDFDDDFILKHIELATQIASIQPINELIKPKKQKIFFEYAGLPSYSRMVDNIHNRKKVGVDELSLYRISNQERERKFAIASERHHVRGQYRHLKHRGKSFKKKRKRGRKRGSTWVRHKIHGLRHINKQARFAMRYGPLALSYDNLPGFFHWGSLVALMDALWVRNTRHPVAAPLPGDLFTINEIYQRTNSFFDMWIKPIWRRFTPNDTFRWNSSWRIIKTSRIRDAQALYREMERYVVQGDYIKLPKERIDDIHDPLLNGIPATILNSPDKTINGPLFSWYSRQCAENNLDQWLLYQRLLKSELLICKKLHDWLRGVVFILLGKQIPAANFQRYMKFYDETLLPYPKPSAAIDDYDHKIGDEGVWDEVIAHVLTVQRSMNAQAKHIWVKEFGNDVSTFEPNTQLLDAILSIAPKRGRRTNTIEEVSDLNLTEYERHLKAKGDEWTIKWAGRKPGDPGTYHPSEMRMLQRPMEQKDQSHHGNRWDDHLVELARQRQWRDQLDHLNLAGPAALKNELGLIQLPDYSAPDFTNIPQRAENFEPEANHLPWPEGFFEDYPHTDDPLYYTRKYGRGTVEDWDRLVRMGIFPERKDKDSDEPVNATSAFGIMPRAWDMSEKNLPLIIHERTYNELKRRALNGEVNMNEMLWLNMVRDKLTRNRTRSSFALFPYPHELTAYSKQHHGSTVAIDPEASNDLYSSNQYNNEWLLLSTLPSIYPIDPPLHEMNFVTTMVSRLEGVIMQLTAEIDNASIHARQLITKAERYETQGLTTPEVSKFVTMDDELNFKLGVTAADALKLDPFKKYIDKEHLASFTQRSALDGIISTLTGLISSPYDAVENRRKLHRSSAVRIKQLYKNPQTVQWLSYQPGPNATLRDSLLTPFGGSAASNRGEVLPLGPVSATAYMLNTKFQYFNDEILLQYTRNRVSQFVHDNLMFNSLRKRREAEEARDQSLQRVHFYGPDGQLYKRYDERAQITIPFDRMMLQLLDNHFEANRNLDPIDRTKKWYHYNATDARPTQTAVDPHGNRLNMDWTTAAVIMDEKKFNNTMLEGTGLSYTGGTGSGIHGADSHSVMRLRKEKFLEGMGRFSTGSHVHADMSIGDRLKFGNRISEWNKYRAGAIKRQVENSVTIDNIDKINHANRIIQSAANMGNKIAMADIYSMDRYDGFSPPHYNRTKDSLREHMVRTAPMRTAVYHNERRTPAPFEYLPV